MVFPVNSLHYFLKGNIFTEKKREICLFVFHILFIWFGILYDSKTFTFFFWNLSFLTKSSVRRPPWRIFCKMDSHQFSLFISFFFSVSMRQSCLHLMAWASRFHWMPPSSTISAQPSSIRLILDHVWFIQQVKRKLKSLQRPILYK